MFCKIGQINYYVKQFSRFVHVEIGFSIIC